MGSIGGKYKIQMRLRRDGETLRGAYFYENVRSDIPLAGTIDGRGDFTLSEAGAGVGALETGFFRGKWSTGEPGEPVELTGNWSTPDGKRVMPFALTEIPVAFSGALRLATREIKEENKNRRYSIGVEYPQLEGTRTAGVEKFNAAARAFALREVGEFKRNIAGDDGAPKLSGMGNDLSIDYTLGVATDDFLSVQFQIGSYYAGAAHPNHNTSVINFDLRRGRMLSLADLFKPAADYLRAISDYCISDLKRQAKKDGPDSMLTDDQIEEGASATLENYRSWLMTREGLVITFDPYQVAPYAAGPQSVAIPYAALKGILKADAPVTSLTK